MTEEQRRSAVIKKIGAAEELEAMESELCSFYGDDEMRGVWEINTTVLRTNAERCRREAAAMEEQ